MILSVWNNGIWRFPIRRMNGWQRHFETWQKHRLNKIRMCVFPKHYDYNHNEPPYYAFEKTEGKWDVHKPCMAFWDRLESHIRKLDEMGIQCDLILFHLMTTGDFPNLSREEAFCLSGLCDKKTWCISECMVESGERI